MLRRAVTRNTISYNIRKIKINIQIQYDSSKMFDLLLTWVFIEVL